MYAPTLSLDMHEELIYRFLNLILSDITKLGKSLLHFQAINSSN